jgi:hypothetical protein
MILPISIFQAAGIPVFTKYKTEEKMFFVMYDQRLIPLLYMKLIYMDW